MNIQKIGHCCLLIKTRDLTILTDPGMFSTGQNTITGIDVVIITHEHADHFHIESLQEVLRHNPKAQVITNSSVGKKLDEVHIAYTVVEGRGSIEVGGVDFEAFDGAHEEIFESLEQVQNTGYFIGDRLFYPGDSFINPERPVDILALPVAGPWCKIGDAIRYTLALRPKYAFPVHDGMLQLDRIGSAHAMPLKVLAEQGIEFVVMKDGDERGF